MHHGFAPYQHAESAVLQLFAYQPISSDQLAVVTQRAKHKVFSFLLVSANQDADNSSQDDRVAAIDAFLEVLCKGLPAVEMQAEVLSRTRAMMAGRSWFEFDALSRTKPTSWTIQVMVSTLAI